MQPPTQMVWPAEGDTLLAFRNRLKRMDMEYRGAFMEQHRRVHWCHKGPNLCYVCALWDALTFCIDGLEEISTVTKNTPSLKTKKGQKQWVFYTKKPQLIPQWHLTNS